MRVETLRAACRRTDRGGASPLHRAALALSAVAALAGAASAQTLKPVQIQRPPLQAQAPVPLQPGQVPPAAPAATPQPAAPPATLSQPLSIVAGTGVLLRLAQPAATVISADPTIARVQPASPTSLFLMGIAPGRTTVIATNEAGAAITQYDITVTQAAGRATGLPGTPAAPVAGGVSPATAAAAQATIARTVTGGNGVRAAASGNDIVLTGTVPTAIAAQQAEAIARAYAGEKAGVIDTMTVLGTIQVNVRVRIAEINRLITRQLGFNWQALGSGNGWRFGLRTGAAALGTISPLLPLGLTPLPNAPVPNQFGGGFTSGNGLWDVNGIVDALAADQLITVLAEPNLTAQSGETASFLAGGEFPIPIAGNASNGTTTITVEFKQFGVSLALVPTVLSPTRLNLRVRPEVSQLSNDGAVSVPISSTATLTIPALTVRRAETTVELGSGQSFAIAGLLQRTSGDLNNAIPGIGELPVIGALFKSNDFQRRESELVIIVTPYIVQPAPSPQALRLPTDGFRPATDLDRILYGRQLAPPLAGQAVDAGFILK